MTSLTLGNIYRNKHQALNGEHSPLDYDRASSASHEKARRTTRPIPRFIPLLMQEILLGMRRRSMSMSRDDSLPVAPKMQKGSRRQSLLPSTMKNSLRAVGCANHHQVTCSIFKVYWFSSETISRSFPTINGQVMNCLPLRKEKNSCPPFASFERARRRNLLCLQRQIWSA